MKLICTLILILNCLFIKTVSNRAAISEGHVEDSDIIFSPADPTHFCDLYFYNLNQNYGKNSLGSCGHVAIGMILSYYDTFLDDSLIDDCYDVNSPGTSFDISNFTSPGIFRDDYTFDNLPNLLNQYIANCDTDLHALLVYLAYLNGYYYNSNTNTWSTSFGMTISQLMQVFDDYLDGYTTLSSSNYSLSYNSYGSDLISRYSCKDYIISMVSNNEPVIINIVNPTGPGHFAVAYKYDSNNDMIYAHFGNTGIKYDIVPLIENGSSYISDVVSFQPFKQHSHSDNYCINNNYYCWCYENITGFHSNHSYYYTNIDYDTHIENCGCGIRRLQNHNYKMIHIPVKGDNNDSIIAYQCRKCGFIRYEGI